MYNVFCICMFGCMFEWAYIRSLACSYGYLFAQAAVEQNLLLDESSTGVHRIV